MKPGLVRGKTVTHKAKVRPWMKPHLDGLVGHKLYSSWAMIYHMEVAARKLLAPHLEPSEEAVGAAMTLDHLGPARLGDTVTIRCRLDRIGGNKIYAGLKASVRGRVIGRGTHVQAVMPKEKFERLARLK